MQKMIRCLLHDLSNCLTGNLALSELYCAKEQAVPSERLVIIRDNCHKERKILQQLSQLHHSQPGNTTYIDLQAFISDLKPLFNRLLPAHAKFNSDISKSSEVLIKFDSVLLQRIFLLTILLTAEAFENASNPILNMRITDDKDAVICQIKSSVPLDLVTEDLTEIRRGGLPLSQIYGPMVRFYLEKHNSCFSCDSSSINLKFPIVA